MSEQRWDFGPEGVVRLVREGGVETVYIGQRIAARTSADVDEHRVSLRPLGGDAVGGANPPARELLLRRGLRGWVATIDGRSLAPIVVPDVPAPARSQAPERGPVRRVFFAVAGTFCLLLLGAAVRAFLLPNGTFRRAAEKDALLRAPHETDPTTTFANDDGSLTVHAPADFKVDQASATSLRLVRTGLVEMFEMGILPSPKTVDLDLVLRTAMDSVKKNIAASTTANDFTADFTEPAATTCHGEPGRVMTGRLVSGAGRAFTVWACVSLRPGIGIGEHLPSIQLFDTLAPDPLVARDSPLFDAMIATTTIEDDAFGRDDIRAATPAPGRTDPPVFPRSVLGGPGHITTVRRGP